MRWRVVASIALAGIAAIPAVAGAANPLVASSLSVAVKPGAGSPRTHFAISFRPAQASGRAVGRIYRITASATGRAGCQSSASAVAPAAAAGATVRVTLAPAKSKLWCRETYDGQVVLDRMPVCPVGTACPEFVPAPQIVGKFTFRVTRAG